MKKVIGGILVVIALAGSFILYQKFSQNGDAYYVQITTDGERFEDKAKDGSTIVDYKYELPAFDKDGQEFDLNFRANKDRPLRKNAYLKVTYNKKREIVTKWEEVKETEIPKGALAHLQ